MNSNNRIVVVGAGAAGLMSAVAATENGADVIVVEKNKNAGRKLNITGKGRCNVTNNCGMDALIENIPQNPRFMYSAFSEFLPQDMMQCLEKLGVPLKTERGNRVFPVSDRAQDVTNALLACIKSRGARIINDTVTDIIAEDGKVASVMCERIGKIECASVIVATGGVSYSATGSTGDGYRFAEKLGHTVKAPQASLVPLVSEPELCRKAQGLTLKNVTLTAYDEKGRKIFSELGEMMFTHFGITGPLVLSASAHMRDFDKHKYSISLDLKPALDEQKLEKRILRDIEEKKNKNMSNLLRGLLPESIIPIVLEKANIDMDVKANELTREKRHSLRDTLKNLCFSVAKKRPVEEAIITSGGISTREINPKTMESKLISGLFFAGEVIDVDGYTGGFNLQIAWSSAYCAGKNAGIGGNYEKNQHSH